MITYNMLEAKTNLSKICRMLTEGEEDCVVLANNGKPIAKIIPYRKDVSKRIGLLKGKFTYSDHFDDYDEEISKMFYGED